MKQHASQHLRFSDLMGSLASEQVWEYETGGPRQCPDVRLQTFNALQTPDDFPPLAAAVLPGDRIALAIDPNIPQLIEVIRGVMEAITHTDAGGVDIILWDEASDETVQAVTDEVGQSADVTRHLPAARESLRYLAADEAAAPIYLNRRLVDADFVLPIVAARPLDQVCSHDLTGIFPALADSATRGRHRDAIWSAEEIDFQKAASELPDIPWLLGVQVILSISVNAEGKVAHVVAGTLDATGKRIAPARLQPDEFPPAAPLVVASLDGDSQQQNWTNAARAAASASRYVAPGGTIVLWTEIDEPPTSMLASLTDDDVLASDFEPSEEESFPPWDATLGLARIFAGIAAEHRLLIHSRLDNESIESMGVGAVGSIDELHRVSQKVPACGVLRAAQFAGSTVVAPYRCAENNH